MLHRAVKLTLLLLTLPAVLPAADVPAAGIPVVGRILGPDGEPRPRAEIRLEPIPPTYERAVLRLEGRPGPEPVATTRSGADGTFELAVRQAGMWKVVVSAPGMLTMECRLVPLVEAAVLPPVELTPAADLEVRLLDAEGRPRPGRVGAVTMGIRGEAWRPQLRLAAAGEDGVARLPLGRGEKIQLEVLADGHPLDVWELSDETSVTITVRPGVAGTVRVVDRHQRPLARAVAFHGSALLPLGLTDADGRLPLVLRAQKPSALKVSAADRSNASFELDLAATGGEMKDLRLDPPATVHGRVLDATSRHPVAGALVWAVRGELAVTDGQGRYALDIGVYKSRWMQAAAAGYQRGFSQLRDDAAEEAPAIALDPAAALSGRVVDPRGGLLAGVEIGLEILPESGRLSPAARRFMRDGWRGRTSSRGTFRVEGLPAGVAFELKLRREGFAPRTLEMAPLEPFESRSGIEVVLEAGRVAFGRVVDADDVPVAGAEVSVATPPPADGMSAVRMVRFEDSEKEPAYPTDGEGRFEIADLAPGRYDLEVRAIGFAPAKVPGVRVAEDAGRVDFGTVIMVPGASIEGRVTDPDGGAIASAEISVDLGRQGLIGRSRSDLRLGQAKTDAEGRFVVADLLPGQPVTLSVIHEGYGSYAAADLRPPTEEPMAIVLHPAGSLVGKVADSRGRPIAGATVSANPDYRVVTAPTMAQRQRRPSWVRTDADGRFRIDDVEPGTLRVHVHAEGYQRRMLTGVELAAGAVGELEIVLEVGAVVEGTVTTADGEPVVQASIEVSERQDNRQIMGFMVSAHGQTDVEGRYRVDDAPTGAATITVDHAGSRPLNKHVEVRPGANVVDLVLERGFAISGRVVAPDGTPAGGATVSIQEIAQPGLLSFSHGTPEEVTAADGSFTLGGLAAGTYAVAASREGWAPASQKKVEVSGDLGGLLLELRRGVALKGRVLGLELDELGSLALVVYGEGGMHQGRVDFAGEYAFDNLAPGLWHLQAQVAASGRSAMMQVEIPEGVSEVEKDIEFGTGFTLSGVVIDGGEPLAGLQVAAVSATGTSGHATTGADGRFRIDDLKAGSCQVMVMSRTGPLHTDALELAGDRELTIELSTGSVSGVVRDSDGEPLDGASVTLEPLAIDADPIWGRLMSSGNPALSDSWGRFQFPRVRRGTWRAVATRSGYAPGEATAVVAGGAAPEVEIRMTPTEGVSFEVALESGAPLQAVQVALLDPSGRRVAAGHYTVVEGRVRVSMVPPGRWDLLVQAGDSAATRFPVTSPGDQGRLVLPTGGTLHLRVPELEQVLIAPLELQGPDGQPFVSMAAFAGSPGEWVMNGGQAMIPELAPGVWTLTVRHEGRTWSGQATVTPGATTEVSLD